MNKKQKFILILASLAIIAMVVYAPYYCKAPYRATFDRGYGLIWQLLRCNGVEPRIDAEQLSMQIAGAVIPALLLIVAFKDKNDDIPEK